MPGFGTMNAFNATKGMAGTQRQTSATFNPQAQQPMAAQPVGMGGPMNSSPIPAGPTQNLGSVGSQYASTGMQSQDASAPQVANYASRAATTAAPNYQYSNVNSQGVSNVAPTQSTLPPMGNYGNIDLSDPQNAALAGYNQTGSQ